MQTRRQDGAADTHLVLIPSYNAGPQLFETVAAARRHGWPVWVVIDGSTDGTGKVLAARSQGESRLRVIQRPRNGGKGAAVLDGLRAAKKAGFTHALVMDSDGQHPASLIPDFINHSSRNPDAMILGLPIFGRDAPLPRVLWRRLSNALTSLETDAAIGDSLFGFRVYPVAPLLSIMETTRHMRRFDFDAEAAVRLAWAGITAINLPAPVRYPNKAQGGVSHFRYTRDNALLTTMHARLLATALWRGVSRLGKQGQGGFAPLDPPLNAEPRAAPPLESVWKLMDE
jgi:glycosyltransferase involved in cell wall biosynthesis